MTMQVFREFVLCVVAIMVTERVAALVISYGLNRQFFKDGDPAAFMKFRAAKPRAAAIVGACYLAIVIELIIVFMIKMTLVG